MLQPEFLFPFFYDFVATSVQNIKRFQPTIHTKSWNKTYIIKSHISLFHWIQLSHRMVWGTPAKIEAQYHQALDTFILRLTVYKRMKPLSFLCVLHGALLRTIWTGKTMLPFTSTYPISIWPTTSWIIHEVGADGWLHIGTLSVNSRLYPPWYHHISMTECLCNIMFFPGGGKNGCMSYLI